MTDRETGGAPGDGLKVLTEFWSAQGDAILQAQQAMARSLLGLTEKGQSDPASPDLSKATDAMARLWSVATEMSAEMASRLPQAVADPRQWMGQWMSGTGLMDDMLAGVAEAPRLADLFDLERRSAGVMRRWTELRQRSLEHQQLLLQTWMEAGQAYSAKLAAAESRLEPKQALALWTEIANRALIEAQRSEPYLLSQRAVIRASTALRLAQNELSEHIGKQYGLPTRTEVDDLHRSMTEMRREVRRTRRELDALQAVKHQTLPVSIPVNPIPGKSTKRKKH